ncbi:MAG: sensor histidine kinase [Oscillospiraceae bacterium]
MQHDENEQLLTRLFPSAAAQLRSALGNIQIAISRLAPADKRKIDGALDADTAILYQSYYRLLRLVNNFSDAPLLLEDKPLPLEDRDLVALTADICRRAEPQAELLGLQLRFSCTMGSHPVAINAVKIERLLLNLLSNAFKFTPRGGSVTVSLKPVSGKLLLSVADTGCGISDDLASTLFDRYLHTERMDPPPHGLGLGLPLCHWIAVGHGGDLVTVPRTTPGLTIALSLPDRRVGNSVVSDLRFDYTGGFNLTLLELADALPVEAFAQRNMD